MSMKMEPKFTTFRYSLDPVVIVVPESAFHGLHTDEALNNAVAYAAELYADLRRMREYLKRPADLQKFKRSVPCGPGA